MACTFADDAYLIAAFPFVVARTPERWIVVVVTAEAGMAILIKDREATIAKLNEHKAGLIRCFEDAVVPDLDHRGVDLHWYPAAPSGVGAVSQRPTSRPSLPVRPTSSC